MDKTRLSLMILPPEATIREAMLSFEKTGIRAVLLCESSGELKAMATEGDIRRAILAGHGLLSPLLPASNPDPVVGRLGMRREEWMQLMSERVYCLPIVDDRRAVHDVVFHHELTFIPIATPVIGEREYRYVSDAVLSGWVSSTGRYIVQFEEMLSTFTGTRHAAVVSSGTVALHLALRAVGIGPGDEVIVPAMTFVATANAVIYCGATPVFVDIDRNTWNMDPGHVEAAITPRTRAIIPVHIYGNPCDMDALMEIAVRHKLFVIEDAAEAHGAECRGRRVGAIGHLGCFSFFGNKIITTGEGGAVVTNDAQLDERIRILRDHGMSKQKRYWYEQVGYNYRMTNMQAALGVAQMERWDQIFAAKERVRNYYDRHLRIPGARTVRAYPFSSSVCWIYSLVLRPERIRMSRDQVLAALKERQVDSRPMFYPVPSMPPYFQEQWAQQFPAATDVGLNGISLPSSVELGEEELQRIVNTVHGAIPAGGARNAK